MSGVLGSGFALMKQIRKDNIIINKKRSTRSMTTAMPRRRDFQSHAGESEDGDLTGMSSEIDVMSSGRYLKPTPSSGKDAAPSHPLRKLSMIGRQNTSLFKRKDSFMSPSLNFSSRAERLIEKAKPALIKLKTFDQNNSGKSSFRKSGESS